MTREEYHRQKERQQKAKAVERKSYEASKGKMDMPFLLLTLLLTAIPARGARFVNSQWGVQDEPFGGDALNSYNDGPTEDGTVMGPFYEIESSSPAAALAPGESLTHVQTTVHFEGPAGKLKEILAKLL